MAVAPNMRDRSGNVTDSRPIVQFLYLLMRGHVHPSAIEDILLQIDYTGPTIFTNGWLAAYCKDVVNRLTLPESCLEHPEA